MSLKLGRLLLKSRSLVKVTAPFSLVVRLQTSQAGQHASVGSPPVKAWLDTDKRRVVMVTEDSKEQQEFPWVWLRDNCQCSECYEKISQVCPDNSTIL